MAPTDDQYSFTFEEQAAPSPRDDGTPTHAMQGTVTENATGNACEFALERHVERFAGLAVPRFSYVVDLSPMPGKTPPKEGGSELTQRIIRAFKRHMLTDMTTQPADSRITRGELGGQLVWVVASSQGPLMYADLDVAERMLWRDADFVRIETERREQRRRAVERVQASRVEKVQPVSVPAPSRTSAIKALEAIVGAAEALQMAAEHGDTNKQVQAAAELRKAIRTGRRVLIKSKDRKRKDKLTND